MSEAVSLERRGKVAVITLNSPPVNAMATPVRAALVARMEEAAQDESVGALVLTGSGRCFSGGADIREFGKPIQNPHLRAVIDVAENSPKPVVAAIHGTAVGGGLELGLGCHFRVGDATARLGLPEIKLGLLPGAGGTQRLPRVIGIEPALEMILSGEYIPAARAEKLGLLDRVVEDGLVDGAVAFAEAVVAQDTPWPRTRDRDLAAADFDGFFAEARARIERRSRGQIAPQRCLEAVSAAVSKPFEEGMALERDFFLECVASDQSRAQRHVFFAERQANKIPDVPPETATHSVASAAVVGCGTMGGGIAMTFANAGIPVTVVETSEDALAKGLETIRKIYAGSHSRGRITQAQMDERLAQVTGSTDFKDIAEADLVIEAVFEDLELKKQVFRTLDQVCKDSALLATNTSTLDVDRIAAVTKRPEQVIGTHFFSPANVMRLLEIVRGEATSKETVATAMKLAKTLGKVGVLVGVCDGFVGNRMLYAYAGQANILLEEGARPQDVDRVITEFGFPMGPFAMSDLAGLDVSWRVRQHQAKTQPGQHRPFPIPDRICELGRFGQKTGAGWYRYEPGSRRPIPDPVIEELILAVAAEQGIARRAISDQEILERCLYPLINEGAKILEEGLALRASDIDIVWVYGYGFPAHRGGPMFHADQIGPAKVHAVMERLHSEQGERLKPAGLLSELSRSAGTFAAAQSEKG